MATRSRIAIEKENGTVESIYCHWDGAPEDNGIKLLENWDYEMAQELIELGDISELGTNPDDTIAYHRDKGEDFNSMQHNDQADFFGSDIEEWGYLIDTNGTWFVASGTSYNNEPEELNTYLTEAE